MSLVGKYSNGIHQSASSKKTPPLRGVCVKHLNRCKTSTLLLICLFSPMMSENRVSFQLNFAGGHSISLGLCPTKLPVKWDIQLGQLGVPAIFEFSVKWLPAKPRTGMSIILNDLFPVPFSQSDFEPHLQTFRTLCCNLVLFA